MYRVVYKSGVRPPIRVRDEKGGWTYFDPYIHRDECICVVYFPDSITCSNFVRLLNSSCKPVVSFI